MNVTKVILKAALLSGLAMALAVIGVGVVLWLLGGFAEALGGFVLVAVVGIPVWVILISFIGIPMHFLLQRRGLTEYRHYANAAVVAVFTVFALSFYGFAPKGSFPATRPVEFLAMTAFISLLIGVPIGLLFRRLVASTLPPEPNV